MSLALATSLLAVALLLGPVSPLVSHAAWRPNVPLGLDLYMPVPEDNPLTTEKVELGRKLFSDPILSRNKSLACAGCHDPERAFTDGRPVSQGVLGRKGTRHVPTLVNRGYGISFFWDGRIPTLEEQVLQPIQSAEEMDLTVEEAVSRLKRKRGYRKQFQKAFQREIMGEDLARALASYVRTILSGNSPFDRYLYGDREALSEEERAGLRLFRGKGNCTACHLGPTFTDEGFHNTGIAWRDGELLDPGRFEVTGKKKDQGAFKTPTLREIAQTAPYMHDGSLATLEEVIEFYNRGGNPNPYLDPELRALHLMAEEKKSLLAFLRSLSGTIQEGMPRERLEND
ncbi:cytochrome-c peroxidase [Acidobacteria bacterium AH-259-O06]|nr:cytochrome-c peroxidase [Acidobacteria bacterium AH-259-O06]